MTGLSRDEIEQLKNAIGWTWIELAKRIDWSPPQLHKYRTGKLEFPEEWTQRIELLAQTVPAILNGSTPANLPYDVIAEAFVSEYIAITDNPDLTDDERAGALWMIGRATRILGLETDVRNRIKRARETA